MTVSLANPRQPQRNEASLQGESLQLLPPSPLPPSPLTPSPLRLVPQPEGLLQIHTAPFRGSFAAVFSQALRSAGLGSRVLVSQFLKGGVDQGVAGSLWLCGRLQWLRPATPHCLDAPAGDAPAEDGAETLAAVQEVWAFSREQLLRGSVDLMVLDELGLAIELGYLGANEVTATLQRRPDQLDVILTGPAMPADLIAMADQVTELRRGF
jgi:cob(I)alamin adenosyltransferase